MIQVIYIKFCNIFGGGLEAEKEQPATGGERVEMVLDHVANS